ncbi:MAG: ferrochelatase [Rudaea sp.]|uniref:ferrochelatase n=1 Tax=unclassified Rudaea TaxID=2627037 RepID=UPI0010F65394|nr:MULTISPECIES: ferrochelatase [unclassified Rudaea]MBN8885404.1 ferrochelatase [Rudaea sp.]MBR0346776.1 ferrochelatase [Rudaea sp.]
MTDIIAPQPASAQAPGAKTTVLLVNLGTPDAPTPAAVRRYLAEFLSDPRVIETPRWLWWPILHGVILRIRPARSAHAYSSIWTEQGSPLLVLSRALSEKLRGVFAPTDVNVELAMRYGTPSIRDVIARLHGEGVRRLLVLPLYPQYSAASTGSAFDATTRALQTLRWPPELRFVNDYHDDPRHIDALAASVQAHWQQHGRAQKLLLSFHGLPQSCIDRGDPYLDHCRATTRLLQAKLGLNDSECALSFQSRVGREVWIKPYTEELLDRWPSEGVRKIQVLCPGFAVDCLETLEEIAIRDRARFIAAGGESLDYIPALNSQDTQVDALAGLIRRHLQGWTEATHASA